MAADIATPMGKLKPMRQSLAERGAICEILPALRRRERAADAE